MTDSPRSTASTQHPRADALSAELCCFEVAGHTPTQVVEALFAKRIIASTTYAVSNSRFAAGVMNTEDEVDRALEAVGEIARG